MASVHKSVGIIEKATVWQTYSSYKKTKQKSVFIMLEKETKMNKHTDYWLVCDFI